jgi:hypothetical protein
MIAVKAGDLHHAKAEKSGKLGNHDKCQNEEPEFGATCPPGKHGVIPEGVLYEGPEFHAEQRSLSVGLVIISAWWSFV